MNQAQLARRLLASAAGLILGATAALTFAAPGQAQGEEQGLPQAPDVQFTNTCEGTTVTLVSGEDLDVYSWTIEHVGGEGAWLEDVPAGETATVDVPSEAGELAVYYEGSEDTWPHTWTAPEEGCDEPPSDGGLGEDVEGELVTVVSCDVLVVMVRNNGEEEPLSFSLTPNEDATHGHADDFLPLLDEEAGEVEIPEGAELDIVGEIAGGETVGPLGPLEIGDAHAHGFQAFPGLEVTIEVTQSDEPLEIGQPVISWDDEVEGLGCPTEDDGEGGELPTTGISTGIIAGGAVALLVLGGGLFLLARRRRVTFTA